MFPPMATIGVDLNNVFRAAPAPGNVVIPVGGEASIDGIVVQVAMKPHDAGASTAADVSVGDSSWQLVAAHPALRPGDTFPWGAYDATIVRIVEPDARFVGWLEVTVKSRVPTNTPSVARRDADAKK
jgi:hypothetical protein